ncbi:MAG: aminoglycoside phosphotransferase family protein [Phycisphaeraceae bacterium]|nr:aminoglycoside phosphotransferase family protein [Phycisphaeraceae bacterium]
MSELDIEQPDALMDYLRRRRLLDRDEMPRIAVLAGGVSNRTVLLERDNGQAWVLKQALAKLRTEVDWFSDPRRIHREALGLKWISELAPPGATPSLVFEDHEHHVLAMTAVPQPHENWKTMLLAGDVRPDHVEQFGKLLGQTQRLAWQRRDELAGIFDDRQFFESLRLEPYFGYAAEQAPEAADFLHKLIDETRDTRLTLVHGDYSPKNILVHQGKLVLLDHEVIHWGDPAFDLGFSLTHLLSKAHHLPAWRDRFAQAALLHWTTCREHLGDVPWADDLEPRVVRQTLGCLLARVVGRSRLEYLNAEERQRQRRAAAWLTRKPPLRIIDLIEQFLRRTIDDAHD